MQLKIHVRLKNISLFLASLFRESDSIRNPCRIQFGDTKHIIVSKKTIELNDRLLESKVGFKTLYYGPILHLSKLLFKDNEKKNCLRYLHKKNIRNVLIAKHLVWMVT